MCQSGLQQLEAEQVVDLGAFQSDLFNQKSLEFYRGTETKETLDAIDSKVELVVKLLAPHMLLSAAHKVLEYLIRIYEVHIHHKYLLLNALLPYFETVYFLKAIQCLNLEKDELYSFLHQFAYQGHAIDKKTLVKALGRNSGLLFTKYSDFCFILLDLQANQDQAASSNLHWKFFGSMMIEVLREHSSDETLLFSVLPFLAKGLKQQVARELKIASFLTIN